MNSPITTLIFDLGNVIIKLDTLATMKAFELITKQGVTQKDLQPILDAYEVGMFEEDEWFQKLIPFLKAKTTIEQLKNAWTAMLKETPIERVNLLHNLKESYKIVILSNTNYTHMQYFNAQLKSISGENNLYPYFCDVAFYSHEINLAKPHRNIYEYVIAQLGEKPESCVFFDDKLDNIEASKELGINGVLVPTFEDFDEVLAPFI